MNVNRLKSVCIEIFKTINDMNPYYLKEIFELAVKQRRPTTAYIQPKNNLCKNNYFWNKEPNCSRTNRLE